MSKFKFGPVQEQWLQSLEAHPERQCIEVLGFRIGGNDYSACCLGELLITYNRTHKKRIPWGDDERLYDSDDFDHRDDSALEYSYEKLGLNDPDGGLIDPDTGKSYVIHHDNASEYQLSELKCLAALNDNGWTWPEIAAWVKKHPELVFTKSL